MASSKPRSYTFYTKPTWRRKLVAWSMLLLYMTQPIFASAEVIADPKAPVSKTPIVQTTANGLPVVQIAGPSVAGVSHNLYQKFNVDPRGLILNNSQLITQTQLAGYITGNPNLVNGSARIILNEVTSNNPSYLRGYTEVAGQKAEVIIANPNGIYGDGFGFINTSRAVLTTGTPVFGGSGSLDAFRVTGGQISIQGAGMNTANVDQVDLISRSVAINAGIWAQNLNVITGSNQVNYNTLHTETIIGDANTPQVAVDVAQLGGMYARKIYMEGTEKGVGVNSQGIISSTGDIVINNEGKVTLTQTSAGGNIAVTTKDQVNNRGSLYAQGNATINAQGDLQNTGILSSGQQTILTAQNISSTGSFGAGITSDGKVGNSGNLILNANGTVTTHGQNAAAGNLSIQGAALDLSGGQTTAGGNTSLTATQGNINNTGGSIQTGNVLTVSAQGTIHNDQDANGVQAQISAGQLNIAAANITNHNSQITQTGTGDTLIIVNNMLDNTAGQIGTNGANATLQAANLINSNGQIQHAGTGNLVLQTNGDITNNNGKISTNGQANFTAQNLDNTQGSITSQKQISLSTRADIKNQQGTVVSGDALTINAQGSVDNQKGEIKANKGLSVTAQSFNNQSGRLVNLDASDMKITVAQDIQNQSGLLGGNGNVNIATQTLENQGGKITSKGNLTINATNGIDSNLTAGQILNNGSIASGGDLTLHSSGKVLLSGNTSANGNIKVNAQGGLANYGTISGQNNTEINTQGKLDNTGTILAGQNTTLTAQTVNSTGTVAAGVEDDGTLGNSGDLTVNASGVVALNGKNMAAANMNINGAALDLKNSKNIAGSDIKLTAIAGDIDHSSATLHTDKTVTVQAQGSIRNDNGNITAAQLTLNGGSISNLSGTMTQVGQGNTIITAVNNIDNTSGTIATNGNSMQIQAASLTNSQGQILHAGTGTLSIEASGDVKNVSGKLATNGQLTVAANTIDNTKGTVTGRKQVNLTTQADIVNNQGTLTGSDTVNINAKGAVNNQQGDMEASKGLELTAQSLDNQNGRLISLDASGLNINVAQDVKNQSGLIGGNGKVNLTSQNLSNQSGRIIAQDNLTITATKGMDNTADITQLQQNGAITSGKDLTLNSEGKVLLSGNTTANGNIKINAQGGLSNYSTMVAKGDTDITTQGTLENNSTIAAGQNTTLTVENITSTGVLVAGIQNDGTLGNSGNLTINASGVVTTHGRNMAAGNLKVTGASLDLKNSKTYAGSNVNLTAATGDIDHNGGTLQVNGVLSADAQGVIRNDNGTISTEKLTLNANSISNRSGTMSQFGHEATTMNAIYTVDNTGGTLITNGDSLTIQSGSLINSQGQIQHAGNGTLSIQAKTDFKNDNGKVATNGQLQLSANNIDNTQGMILAKGINLTANGTLQNNQGTIASSVDAIRINAQGTITNEQGSIEASKGLEVTGLSLDNQKGRLVSLDTSGITVNVLQDIQNQSGLIGGNGDINLEASSFDNSLGQVIAQGSIKGDISQNINNTNGNIAAQQNVILGQTTTNVSNTQQGTISASKNMTIMANSMDNTDGNLIANQNIDIHAKTVTTGGKILAGQDLNLTVTNDFIGKDGDLKANKNIYIAADHLLNKGNISAVGEINLNANSITNETGSKVIGNKNLTILATGNVTNSGIMAGSATQINAQNITNNGSVVADQLIINTDNLSNTGNSAAITTNQSADLTVRTTLNNTNGANIYTNGTTDTALNIKTSALNNSGVIASGGNTTITAQTIQSSGTIGSGINRDGTLGMNGDLALKATDTISATGSNLAAGTITANTKDINLTGAKTWAGKDIHLTAATGDINNTGAALQANGTITLEAANALNNDQDTAGNIASIQGNDIAIHAAGINNVGGKIIQFGTEDTNITASGKIDNANGSIVTNGKNLNIKADTLAGSQSHIIHAGTDTLNITTTTSINNNNGSSIQSNGNININTSSFDNTKGAITALQGIGMTSNTLTNDQGTLAASGGVTINIGNGLSNQQGTIEAGKVLTLNAQSIHNNRGSITSLDTSGMTVTAVQNIDNTAGTIGGNGNVNLTAQSLANTNGKVISLGNIKADVSQSIDNISGTIAAQQDVTIGKIDTNTITNTQGNMTAGGNLSVQANRLSNTNGTMAANKDITLTASTINGIGKVTAGQDLNFVTTSDLVYSADDNLKANRDLNLTAANITNSGNLAAVKNLNITANNVINNTNATLQGGVGLNINANGNITNSGTMEGNTANITGQNIVNTGSVFGNNLTLTADTIANNGSTAVIAATQNINLFAKTSVENKDDANIYSMGNINIAGSKKQDGNGEYIDKTNNVLNQSANIEADGNIGIYANTLTNKMKEYEIGHTVVSETRYDQVGVYQANDLYYEKTGDKNLYFINQNPNQLWNGETLLGYYPGGTSAKAMTPSKISYDGFFLYPNPSIWLLGETVTEVSLTPKSSIGKIMAGENIKLKADTVNNDMGWIMANGTLNMLGNLNNTSAGNNRITTRQLIYADTVYLSYHDDHVTDIEIGAEYRPYFGLASDRGFIGKSYSETITEQIPGGTSSMIGGGKQVTIQGGNVNNTTVAATSVPITAVNNLISFGASQGSATVKTGDSPSSQSTGINPASGYVPITSTSIPIGNMQTLLPKTQNQTVASTQTGGNTNSQITNMPVNTTTNIISSTENQSVTSVQTKSNQTTIIPKDNIIQTMLPSGKAPEVTSVKQTVDDSKFSVPTNGLYTTQKEPSSKYLVETNSRFTNYGSFISSDYMLNQLNIDPAKTMKRLGDGFYEEKLVREQVTDLTGRYFLNDYSSAEEQYKALMNNGAVYAKQFNLQVGVALTNEQMSQLTSDIVWMVEKEVNGQKVLVPQVYLANSGNIILKADGAIISADNVQITASGDVNNAGAIKASESVNIQAVNISNYGGTIDGGKGTQLTAGQNIVNFGGSINGGQTQLIAGNDIKNETISFTSTLPIMTKTTAGNIASINANQNLVIQAGHDISITGAKVIAGENVAISSGGNFTVGSIKEQDRIGSGANLQDNTNNIVSIINAGNNVTLTSEGDASLHGVKVTGKQDVTINTKGNLTVDSIEEQDHLALGKNLTHVVSNVVSDINGGANVSIISTGDTTLKGAKITAGSSLDLISGGNINITAVKDETILDKTVGSSSNWKRTRTDDETVIGTTLQGGGEVTVKTTTKLPDGTIVADSENRGNITIAGSTINSKNDKVTISADKNVTIQEVTEKHEALVVTHKKTSGFLSSTTKDTMDHALINEVKGSTISGDTVAITSGNDLTVKGSNVVGTKDVTLDAAKDVNITSAAETGADDHYSYTKKSGFFSGGGFGFTIGSQSTKITTNEKTLDEIGSTIGSIDGNVTIKAGNKVDSAGTTFIAGKDLNITGKDVTIDNTINTVDSQTKYEFKQSGLSVSLAGGIVDTATSAYNNIERSGQVQDKRLQALYDYKAYEDLDKINDQLDKGISKENLEKGVSIKIGIGSTKITSTNTVHAETVNTSNINAGGNVNITATVGDISLKGTKINAKDITLDAKDNINIESAENKLQTTSNTSSSSTSIGTSFGLDTRAFGGLTGSFQSSKGYENENSITNSGSIIDASGTLKLKSGKDTNISGSQVIGDKVIATIDGNLNITSLQDTDNYTANNQSGRLDFTAGGAPGSRTGSIEIGKTDSTYASVTDQAGIFAGVNGFNMTVGKNTDLKGAVIFSEATSDKNKLSTETITYSNIGNRANYDSSSFGVKLDTHGKIPLTPILGMPSGGDASSTTQASISPGTIEVRSNPNADLSGLSRDPNDALNALDKIFDKKTVEEKQELAQMFGEVANDLVGKIASKHQKEALEKGAEFSKYMYKAQEAYKSGDVEKATEYQKLAQSKLEDAKNIMSLWGPGGTMKILLHTVVGGITANLSGGNVSDGALGDGVREASRKLLTSLSPEERQWAAIIIGGAVGGTTGAGTGILGAKHNHDIENIFDNPDFLAFAMFGSKGEASKDRLFSNEFNTKIMPLYLTWCQQTTDVLGPAGVPFKYAIEVQKKLYEHYDDAEYGLEQANIDAFLGMGLDIAQDEIVGKGSSYIAEKFNLPSVAKKVLEQIMSKTLDIAKEKAR